MRCEVNMGRESRAGCTAIIETYTEPGNAARHRRHDARERPRRSDSGQDIAARNQVAEPGTSTQKKAAAAMDDETKVQRQMDHLEALADAWAEEANITAMVNNVTSPMNLNAKAPADVKRKFHDRMNSQIFALMQQSFIEGAVRGVDLVNEERRAKAASN